MGTIGHWPAAARVARQRRVLPLHRDGALRRDEVGAGLRFPIQQKLMPLFPSMLHARLIEIEYKAVSYLVDIGAELAARGRDVVASGDRGAAADDGVRPHLEHLNVSTTPVRSRHEQIQAIEVLAKHIVNSRVFQSVSHDHLQCSTILHSTYAVHMLYKSQALKNMMTTVLSNVEVWLAGEGGFRSLPGGSPEARSRQGPLRSCPGSSPPTPTPRALASRTPARTSTDPVCAASK